MMRDSANMLDFGFAFNDKDFSDRVLHLEIIPEETATRSNDSDSSVGVELKTLHISSPILAVNSPFFFKLFKTDMIESPQKDVTLRINSADKFQVTSCMKYCIQLLLELPMSLDSAILHIDLPPSLLASEIVQPLIDASKKVLVAGYMDFSKSQEKAMELSLAAMEVVLGSDGLRVQSEDDVFEFILKWARAHYPTLEERREVLTKRLTPFIRFPYMSCLKLKEVLVCTDFDHERMSKLVSEALICKVEVPYGQHVHAGGRAYVYPLVKVVQLEFRRPRCVVYFNLKKDECENHLASKELNSQTFLVGGRSFFLTAQCSSEEPRSFGLFLERSEGSGTCTLDFELGVMIKSSDDFQSKLSVTNLLGISWTDFMSDDSDYFINGILHLRAKITLNNSEV